jgi:single-strand DNA-binding protein
MLNRVILIGRLVSDPELKTTTSGISVTSFRIAVDRSYVKQGEERQADFFDIVAWRGSAEFVCRNFGKGSMIAVDGQLQSRQYQAQDGTKRTVVEVVADNVSFTGERRNDTNEGNYTPRPENAPQANYSPNTVAPQQGYSQPQQGAYQQQTGYSQPQQGYNFNQPQQSYNQQQFNDYPTPSNDDLPF